MMRDDIVLELAAISRLSSVINTKEDVDNFEVFLENFMGKMCEVINKNSSFNLNEQDCINKAKSMSDNEAIEILIEVIGFKNGMKNAHLLTNLLNRKYEHN